MQYSDSSTKQGLVEEVNFFTNTDSTSYAANHINRNLNNWYSRVVGVILENQDEWDWDDVNLSSIPRKDIAMVAATEGYSILAASGGNITDLFKVVRVEVTWDGTNYLKAHPLHFNEREQGNDANAVASDFSRDNPFYQLFGNNLILRPIPAAVDVTNGGTIRIWYARNFDAFTSADTTQAPGFVSLWHRILSMGASYDWFLANGPDSKVKEFRGEIELMMRELAEFYSNRSEDRKYQFSGADNKDYT